MTLPPVFITRIDHQRLNALLESMGDTSLSERLGEEVERAIIVTGRFARGFVALGSLVEIENVQSGRVRRVRLAMPAEAKSDPNALSVISPAGVALVGLKEGAEFRWLDDEGREQSVRVLKIIKEGHPSGDDGPSAA